MRTKIKRTHAWRHPHMCHISSSRLWTLNQSHVGGTIPLSSSGRPRGPHPPARNLSVFARCNLPGGNANNDAATNNKINIFPGRRSGLKGAQGGAGGGWFIVERPGGGRGSLSMLCWILCVQALAKSERRLNPFRTRPPGPKVAKFWRESAFSLENLNGERTDMSHLWKTNLRMNSTRQMMLRGCITASAICLSADDYQTTAKSGVILSWHSKTSSLALSAGHQTSTLLGVW